MLFKKNNINNNKLNGNFDELKANMVSLENLTGKTNKKEDPTFGQKVSVSLSGENDQQVDSY